MKRAQRAVPKAGYRRWGSAAAVLLTVMTWGAMPLVPAAQPVEAEVSQTASSIGSFGMRPGQGPSSAPNAYGSALVSHVARPPAAPQESAIALAEAGAQTAVEVAEHTRTFAVAGPGLGGVPAQLADAYARAAAGAPAQCNLPVSLLAAIGQVESGSLAGRSITADNRADPAVYGPALTGVGFASIPDSDGGALDGDRVWDRAVGPMQFIPGTWRAYGTDGDGDGRADPQNVYDATASAARYLCAGGRDLSTEAGLRSAILSYNFSSEYLVSVYGWKLAFESGARAPLFAGRSPVTAVRVTTSATPSGPILAGTTISATPSTANGSASPQVSTSASATPSGSASPTISALPSGSTSASPTSSPSASTSPSSDSASPTASPTQSPTATPTQSPTATPTESATATPTGSPTATSSATTSPTPTPSTTTPTPSPSTCPTPSPAPSGSPTPMPTPSPTPTPTPSLTPTPSPTPTVGPNGCP